MQQAELEVIGDGPGKPIQIWNVIGRRPTLAAGTSNGDRPMLAFTGEPAAPALRLLVVHDDAEREFAYPAGAKQVLRAVQDYGWTAISMQRDWRQVFPG